MHLDTTALVRGVVLDILTSMGVPPEKVRDDATVLSLVWDEDATFELIPRVERTLGVDVPNSEWERVITVGDMIAALERCLQSSGDGVLSDSEDNG